ncbi:hypothetical protein Tco_0424683 [Tanacetum coccineum]
MPTNPYRSDRMDFILMTSFILSRNLIEITDREVKRLKRNVSNKSRFDGTPKSVQSLHWNAKDQFRKKQPTLVPQRRAVPSAASKRNHEQGLAKPVEDYNTPRVLGQCEVKDE